MIQYPCYYYGHVLTIVHVSVNLCQYVFAFGLNEHSCDDGGGGYDDDDDDDDDDHHHHHDDDGDDDDDDDDDG